MSTSNASARKRSPARGKKPYHHGDLRRALLREARAALEERGPAALSLREVARRAGVSQAAPYRHFPDKEGLLAALAEEGYRELGASCRRAAAKHDDPLAKFYAYADAYTRFATRNPQVYPLMFGSVRERWDDDVAAAGEEAFGAIAEQIRECQEAGVFRAGDPVGIAGLTTSLCHGLASLWNDNRAPRNVSISRLTRMAFATLVEGLRPRAD